jgi:hypothetical protein
LIAARNTLNALAALQPLPQNWRTVAHYVNLFLSYLASISHNNNAIRVDTNMIQLARNIVTASRTACGENLFTVL